MNWTDYRVTTSAKEYEDWPWFRARLAALEKGQTETGRGLSSGTTSIDIGAGYVQWVLETPTVCDLLFKASQGVQLTNLESNLLVLSASYFEILENIAQQSSRLSGAWPVIIRGMKGEFGLSDAAAVRKHHLMNNYFFAEPSDRA